MHSNSYVYPNDFRIVLKYSIRNISEIITIKNIDDV